MSVDFSGCGDGSGDVRLDSLNSIFEVDYYESLPYQEAEKFCLVIGGSLLEKHARIFPFDLWLPRKQGLCYKYLAYGSGEILGDCTESVKFACKKQKCHLLSFEEKDGFYEILFDENCRDQFFNFVKKEEFFILDSRTGSRTQIKESLTRYWPDDQTQPVNIIVKHEIKLDGRKYSLIDDFAIKSQSKKRKRRSFSPARSSSSTNLFISKIYKKYDELMEKLKKKDLEISDLNNKLQSYKVDSKMKTEMIGKNKDAIIRDLRSALKDAMESKGDHLNHVDLLSESKKKIVNLQNQLKENSRAAKYKETNIEAQNASLKKEIQKLNEEQQQKCVREVELKKQLLESQNEEKILKTQLNNQRMDLLSLQKKFERQKATLMISEEAEKYRMKHKRKETEIEAENAILKKGVQILKEKQQEQSALEEDLKKQLSESQNEKETLKAKLGEKEKEETQKKAESKARRVLSFQKQELVDLKSQVQDQTSEIDELKLKVQELELENEKLTGLAGKSERKLRMKIMKIAKICEE
ncbi:Oidioi.mRNA.OKI2018_I69.PAR.g8477.t1.cds [Oikopleura dioica]|uniref:Oidioi.mRNA.OKI2018_I69.PAR.g8477.t1.cds n=1 Tax=Oikopleura dioica TaxID=34765 RepID=A0ABN7RNJ0_OIKDI|nr:Oidioi.mRNA.OKI2018_I69.PAR.g8477.t1.cds [Oikopleura dioica]